MRTRLLALTAAIPLTVLCAGTGSPALAQPGAHCGAYPPGNPYVIRASTNHTTARVVQVHVGGSVALTARVVHDDENCSGRHVSFFVHGPHEFSHGVAAYHWSASAVTDGNGIAVVTKTVTNSFRWFAAYSSDNGTGVVSSRGADRLVQAIP